MNRIIKVMGLPRSGTNATSLILSINFDHYVCDTLHHGSDFLGWKHAYPPTKDILRITEERTHNEVLFIFMYRDYDDWREAVRNRYSGGIGSEFLDYSFGDDGFIFNTPMGGELFKSIEHYYNDRIESYKKFISENPKKSILINFKELKDQKSLLFKIQQKFNLNKSTEEFCEINKIVSYNKKITNVKI